MGRIVDVELSSACNLRCSFCDRTLCRRERGLMHASDLRDLASFLSADDVAWFSGLGEPFFHPRIADAVSILRESGAFVYTNTNGSIRPFGERLAEAIPRGLRFVNVSVYGATAEEYLARTGRDVFDMVRQNVGFLRGTGLPFRLSYVLTEGEAEEERAKALRQAFGDARLYFKRAHSRSRCEGEVERDGRECFLYSHYWFVCSDGQVLACVNDLRAETSYGHVSAWDGRKSGYPFGICRKCDCTMSLVDAKQEEFFKKVRRLSELDGPALLRSAVDLPTPGGGV